MKIHGFRTACFKEDLGFRVEDYVSYSLNSLKGGGHIGDCIGDYIGIRV